MTFTDSFTCTGQDSSFLIFQHLKFEDNDRDENWEPVVFFACASKPARIFLSKIEQLPVIEISNQNEHEQGTMTVLELSPLFLCFEKVVTGKCLEILMKVILTGVNSADLKNSFVRTVQFPHDFSATKI